MFCQWQCVLLGLKNPVGNHTVMIGDSVPAAGTMYLLSVNTSPYTSLHPTRTSRLLQTQTSEDKIGEWVTGVSSIFLLEKWFFCLWNITLTLKITQYLLSLPAQSSAALFIDKRTLKVTYMAQEMCNDRDVSWLPGETNAGPYSMWWLLIDSHKPQMFMRVGGEVYVLSNG